MGSRMSFEGTAEGYLKAAKGGPGLSVSDCNTTVRRRKKSAMCYATHEVLVEPVHELS